METYDYDVSKGIYWVKLNPPKVRDNPTETKTKPSSAISYYSDTGQLNSNCFFFVEGSDSDVVKERIADILKSSSSQQSLLDIVNLANQDMIASYVFKYVIQNNLCSFALMDECLSYLANTSKYFMEKTNTTKTSTRRLNQYDSTHISRCSYKFCNHTYCCQYNYPDGGKRARKPTKGCYSDHFPHAKVYQDIVSLHGYVKNLHESSDDEFLVIRSNQEIIKCINTIAYVIKHMYDELWNIYISCKKDISYEELHRNIT